MSEKKNFRRFNYLTRKHRPYPKRIIDEWVGNPSYGVFKLKIQELSEIYSLGHMLGYTHEEIWSKWTSNHLQQKELSGEYHKHPVRERKDNKTVINYGRSNTIQRGWLRYPKKKRKTAWKRFYKLFPHLNKSN